MQRSTQVVFFFLFIYEKDVIFNEKRRINTYLKSKYLNILFHDFSLYFEMMLLTRIITVTFLILVFMNN